MKSVLDATKWRRITAAAACVVAGAVVGASLSPTKVAFGEVAGTPVPPAFQAGSVPILREISATLRQIDGRLARLEVTAQKLQSAAPSRGAIAQPPSVSGRAN